MVGEGTVFVIGRADWWPLLVCSVRSLLTKLIAFFILRAIHPLDSVTTSWCLLPSTTL